MISSIKFEEYKQLNSEVQESLLWKCAIQIMQRNEPMYTYILYQLNDFYIEVVYSVSLNLIVTYIAFEDMVLIDPYLEEINIDWLPFLV